MIGRLKLTLFAGALALTSGALVAGAPAKPLKQKQQADRPNVVIILADDLGFSDLGAFGGEIATPNLDQLAYAGLRLTDFHASPTCSPTRSMLLSGTDNHTAGVGAMAESGMADGRWGYEGHLTTRVATLAERMRGADYTTLMAGKWHLGLEPDQDPHARGFEHSFALLQGAHNHFGKGGFGPDGQPETAAWYSEDGVRVGIPAQFYSSDYFTAKLMGQIDAAPKDRPFFAYLAFTAPHSPLQAPAELIAKYKGRYDGGWDKLREQRLKRMKALDLVDENVTPAPFRPDAGAWDKLDASQRRVEARKMEIYAAMVERMDENVGRLVRHLRDTGQYSKTIFIFSSDNGAAGEVPQTFSVMPGELEFIAKADNRLDNLGSASSFVMYGPYWAQAAMAPSRMHKGWMTEGGTRVPAIVSYAGFKRQGNIGAVYGNVMDIVPTILEATGGNATLSVNRRDVAPVRGRSMLSYLLDRSPAIHGGEDAIAMELHGQRSVRQGRWKLLRLSPPFGDGAWALYDLQDDPAEQKNIAAQHPEQVRKMQAAWDRYAAEARIAAP